MYSTIARYICGQFRCWLKIKFRWNTWRYQELDDGRTRQKYKLLDMVP
ncbi:MAG: hypothetical protein LBS60_15245 [Deltaproteobacteria bacterium]|nr:hypothetical protein [Deltaproteobacteria bacterium]